MKYIDAERLKCELEKRLKNVRDYMNGAGMKYKGPKYYKAQGKESAYDALLSVIDSLQQEKPRSRFIQVKCVYPHDESWEKDKIYTCEVWHHGDLNRDFWDVYYDYGKDPKYVQFPTIELLNKEFAIIQDESQVIPEQPEVE